MPETGNVLHHVITSWWIACKAFSFAHKGVDQSFPCMAEAADNIADTFEDTRNKIQETIDFAADLSMIQKFPISRLCPQ